MRESLEHELSRTDLTPEERAAVLIEFANLTKESDVLQLAVDLLERKEREEQEQRSHAHC